MNNKQALRVVLDILLTVLLVVEMFIQYTGVLLHEVIGFAFFATVAVHLVLSTKWIKNTAGSVRTGKLTKRRTALAVMGILLFITIVVLGVSSVAISNLLAQAGFSWTIGSYALWTTVHAVSSYVLCALVVIHLGMHWAFLASAFRVPYNPSRRRAINVSMHAVAAVGALALGVMAASKVAPSAGSSDSAQGSFASEMSQGKGRRNKSDRSGSSVNDSAKQSVPSQGSGSSGLTGGSSGAIGICTLCRKRCSLSAPQCDKPYLEGLL